MSMLDAERKKMAEELLFGEKKKPSFAKQLYFGKFDPSILPYPVPSPEEKKEVDRYIEKLKAFAESKIDPIAIDKKGEIPKEVIEGLADLGLLSITIPKEYGGLGLSQYAYCKAMEVIAARCAATALFINAHQSVGLKAILLFGTPQQKEKWLPKLCQGKALAAFSLTEPNAGSDAAGIETKAKFDPSRKVYSITGRKQWTTNGGIADILTVMARTDVDTPSGKESKITAFLVTPDMPGFKVTAKALDKVGMRGSTTSNLAFENVEVPAENILGPLGGGLKVCLTVLDYGRTTFGATCTGVAKELVRMASEHALKRYQFKRPLASFALVKKKIADMHALTYAMESTTYLTAGLVDRGVEDVMLESAILKVFNSDSLWSILYDTMQIFGGRSFFTDLPLERNMRDARLNMIGEGSNEVLRAFIGAVGMRDVGMGLKKLKESFEANFTNKENWKESFEWLKRYITSPDIPITTDSLQPEVRKLSSAIRLFGWSVFKALAKYKEEIIEKQQVLNRIAEAAMALYTITAVLSRLDAAYKTNSIAPNEREMALYYCKRAFRNLKNHLSHLFDPIDEETESLSDAVIGLKK